MYLERHRLVFFVFDRSRYTHPRTYIRRVYLIEGDMCTSTHVDRIPISIYLIHSFLHPVLEFINVNKHDVLTEMNRISHSTSDLRIDTRIHVTVIA